MAITKRQREVYDFVAEFIQRNGYTPSYQEIGNGLGMSSLATVHKHVCNLEDKGLLSRDHNCSRSMVLLPPKGRLKQAMSLHVEPALPLMGRIAAGQPIEAIERPETISLFTARESAPEGTSRALGWDTPSAPSQSGRFLSAHAFGHLGYTGTSLWIDPRRELSVTLLTNRTWPDCANQAVKQVRPKFHDAVVDSLKS